MQHHCDEDLVNLEASVLWCPASTLCRPLGLTRPGCDQLGATRLLASVNLDDLQKPISAGEAEFLRCEYPWAKRQSDKESSSVGSAPISGTI